KKLNQTQENLDRVQDILYELESQLEPLKKQADIARSFLNQKEKLTDLDIGVTVRKIQSLAVKIEEDTNKKTQVDKDLKEVAILVENLEQKQKTQNEKLVKIEEIREKTNEKLIDIVREKERTEAALNLFDEKARHREVFIGEKKTSIKQLNERINNLNKELEQITSEYEDKDVELKEINKKIKALEDKRAYLEGDKEVQMDELRSHYIELLQQQTSLRNEKKYLEQELIRSEKEKQKTSNLVSELEENIEKQSDIFDKKQENYEKINEELLVLLNKYKTKEQLLSESRQNLHTQNERVHNTVNELERAKAKQSSLQEMQENYAGYYAGVRAVMQQKDKLKGIIGT